MNKHKLKVLNMLNKLLIILVGFTFFSSLSVADSHHPQDFLNQIKGKKEEGLQIYQHFCSNCHAEKPIIPLGAPRIKHSQDWEKRLKQGLTLLFQHTAEGLNAMPPRGGCFECTDEQLLLAVIHMLPTNEKKAIKNYLKSMKINKQQSNN